MQRKCVFHNHVDCIRPYSISVRWQMQVPKHVNFNNFWCNVQIIRQFLTIRPSVEIIWIINKKAHCSYVKWTSHKGGGKWWASKYMQTSDRESRCHPNGMEQKASEQNVTLKNMNFQEKFIECNKTRRVSEQIITTLTRPYFAWFVLCIQQKYGKWFHNKNDFIFYLATTIHNKMVCSSCSFFFYSSKETEFYFPYSRFNEISLIWSGNGKKVLNWIVYILKR